MSQSLNIEFIEKYCCPFVGIAIHCYNGKTLEPSREDIVDCSKVGLQREELYCRNVSEYRLVKGQTKELLSVNRTCVPSTW